jgi:Fe-Mn family superoxide dismutase
MPQRVAPLPFKPSRLSGLSERLLASHYENNYGGALRRLNAIEQQLARLDPAVTPGYVLNGLKREQLIAANSVILHEAYFDSLGGRGDVSGDLASALARDFGSVARWRAEFVAMGKALAGGSGWVLLTWSPQFGRLSNQWAADHAHCLAGGQVVLALDMYEHAYHLDFGAAAAAYVDAFMANVHWERVGARLAGVQSAAAPFAVEPGDRELAVEELQAMLDRDASVVIADARLADDFAAAPEMLPGAVRLDPAKPAWAARQLPRDRPVAVYCVYGFQVSRDVAAALRSQGIDARHLAGGLAAWRAIGGRTVRPSATQTLAVGG